MNLPSATLSCLAALALPLPASVGAASVAAERTDPATWAPAVLASAAAAADRIEDPAARARTLTLLAEAHAQAGDHFAAGEALRRALAAAGGIRVAVLRDWALHDVAAVGANAGDADEALRIADSIADRHVRDRVLQQVALKKKEAGDFEGALAAARRMSDAAESGRTLREIAYAQTVAGDPEAALARARTSCRIAVAELAAGNAVRGRAELDRALATIGASRARPEPLASALRDAAAAALDIGETALARTILRRSLAAGERIRERGARDRLLAAIARTQGRLADGSEALPTVMRIDDAALRRLVVRDIAVARSESGSVATVLALAERLSDPPLRAAALFGALSAGTHHADDATISSAIALATRAAQGLEEPALRAAALGSLAAVHARSGALDDAWAAYREAVNAASGAGTPEREAAAYVEIAASLRGLAPPGAATMEPSRP